MSPTNYCTELHGTIHKDTYTYMGECIYVTYQLHTSVHTLHTVPIMYAYMSSTNCIHTLYTLCIVRCTHCVLCAYVSYKIFHLNTLYAAYCKYTAQNNCSYSTQSTLYPLHGYYGVVRANMSGHTSRPDCTVAGMSTVLGIVWDVGWGKEGRRVGGC